MVTERHIVEWHGERYTIEPLKSFSTVTALSPTWAVFRRGEFMPLREWLRKNIHSQGRRYPAAELGRRVTGQSFSHDALMRHLRGKFTPLYDLQ